MVEWNDSSKKYSLNIEDGKKIGKGLLIAVGGAALTYLAQVLLQIDFGNSTEIIVAIGGVAVNILWKFLKRNE